MATFRVSPAKEAEQTYQSNVDAKGIQQKMADQETALDRVANFGRYQALLLVILWWANVSTVGNVVFMVFGGAGDVTENSPGCMDNSTAMNSNCKNGSLWTFYSFVPQWSMENEDWLLKLMTSIQLLGAFVGAALGGQLADWYGRKLNTWFWLAITVLLGPLSALSPSWQIMTVFRFFIGLSTGGYDASAIILAMEWVNSKSRLPVQTSLDCVNSLGFIWISLLAYLCRNWWILSVVCCLQGIPCLIGFWWLEEPPRWLLMKGKVDKATAVVKKVSRWNKAVAVTSDMQVDPRKKLTNPEGKAKRSNYCDLFRTRRLIQYSLMLIYSFLVTGTTGYMLIFNVGNLLGNIFLNFGLLGAVNAISALITVVGNHVLKLGRRHLHQICLNGVWISFAVIIIIYCLNVQDKVSGLLVAAAMIGSLFSFPLWVLCNLYSGELYPTNIRNMGSGIGSMSARFGGIIAPQILLLFDTKNYLPFVVIAGTAMINVVLAFFFLPETRGKLQDESGGFVPDNSGREKSESKM